MPAKHCPNCLSTELITDLSRGDVVCSQCYAIVEDQILVSEVGFAEGSGGRTHVVGQFVGHGATGFRGGGSESSENVKKQGHERIRLTGQQMNIPGSIWRQAQRYFTLAVDAKFNKGRRTEYIVASCLYLQCRYQESDKMLIDFSERLSINVFELGATYLKLRSVLQLKDPIPDVDPAHYNIRFAHRLDFGAEHVNRVAADATRLVRRFRADWMTQGRRPAGVCGACMIIAARMSGFLRTPEEVSQVVKVSAVTIRKRLVEFSKTQMAGRTVQEWRDLEDDQLDVAADEEPPIVKENRKRDEMAAEKARVTALRSEGFEDDEGDEDDAGDGDEDEGNESGGGEATDEEEEHRPKKRGRPSKRNSSAKGRGRTQKEADDDVEEAIHAVAGELEQDEAEEEDVEDDDDRDLDAMEQGDFIRELNQARDNPEQVAEDNAREAKAFKRALRALKNDDPLELADAEFSDSDEEADKDGEDEAEADEEEEENGKEIDEEEEEEDGEENMPEAGQGEEEEVDDGAVKPKKKARGPRFTAWDNPEEVYKHVGQTYFEDEMRLFKLSDKELKERVDRWLNNRDPREVVNELAIVERARRAREQGAKAAAEEEFPDLDDDELEGYYQMEEDELRLRTRVWLSNNGKWLEESKERQAKKEAYNKAHNIDPNKPKNKRKRRDRQKGPFNSAREAIENFASQKKFSSRLNYGVLNSLGLGDDEKGKDEGLQEMDDEKDDDDDWGDHEKHDEKEEDTGDDPNNW